MEETNCTSWHHKHKHGAAGNGAYGLGVIGAAVYFIQQVHGFWPVILAILKSLVWPALLVYKLLVFLR